ncbi:MAG: L-2-amino-thiazoline-4-carboxylic acid hydrolase [Chloroflexi bacterium]|nr:L-2-amino-thiazoline-4-carboxylic acid hydrolase [Chloroflexota bacterium]
MNNYYLQNEMRILREIKLAIPHYQRFIAEAYGDELADCVVNETLERFAALLPGIPYIGGDETRQTENLYLSAAMLAFYQALKAQGKPVEEVARLICQGTASLYTSFPFHAMLWWEGRKAFNCQNLGKLQREAVASQTRQYPGNWVYNFVPGDGQKFLFGVDYTECGIVKYLTEQGAPELAPYLCWLDYPMCAAMGMGLIRTKTLALGDKKCNFRLCLWQEQPETEPNFLNN